MTLAKCGVSVQVSGTTCQTVRDWTKGMERFLLDGILCFFPPRGSFSQDFENLLVEDWSLYYSEFYSSMLSRKYLLIQGGFCDTPQGAAYMLLG